MHRLVGRVASVGVNADGTFGAGHGLRPEDRLTRYDKRVRTWRLAPWTHFRISSVEKPFAVACTLQGYALVFRDIHIVTGIACLWVKDAAGRHSLRHTEFHWPEVPQRAGPWSAACPLPDT